MNKQKIAILVDSCNDVPSALREQYGMYTVPLTINYRDKSYRDIIEISAEEVYNNFDREIPTTSLPAGEDVLSVFEQIKNDGYEKVLAIIISSGLSGTYTMLKMLGAEFEGLDVFVVDTKNIAIGSGFTAIVAAQYLERGMLWEELKTKAVRNVSKSKVFFCIPTLEYLRKGGRIGLVASVLGDNFNIKPIISCNSDGVYHTAAKTLGRKRSFCKAVELAAKFASQSERYMVALMNGGAREEVSGLKHYVLSKLKGCEKLIEGQISPVLGVHTGPGLVGIGVQVL